MRNLAILSFAGQWRARGNQFCSSSTTNRSALRAHYRGGSADVPQACRDGEYSALGLAEFIRTAPSHNYHTNVSVTENANGSALHMTATFDAKGVPDIDAKKAVDGVLIRFLCLSGPVLCFADPRSVIPAEFVQFDGVPIGPVPLIMHGI